VIVVDASALLAMLLDEADGPDFREVLLRAGTIRLSPIGYWEAAVRLQRFRGSAGVEDLDRLLRQLDVVIAPATAATASIASEAEARFGKRTAARLNLGDCFAYALARELDAPLLFKGDGFPRTDIKSALPA